MLVLEWNKEGKYEEKSKTVQNRNLEMFNENVNLFKLFFPFYKA